VDADVTGERLSQEDVPECFKQSVGPGSIRGASLVDSPAADSPKVLRQREHLPQHQRLGPRDGGGVLPHQLLEQAPWKRKRGTLKEASEEKSFNNKLNELDEH